MSFVNSDSDNNSFGSRISIRTRRSRSGRRIYPRGNDDYMMPQDPIPFRPRKLVKHQTPQEAIDEFWAKFTTKAPGKGEPSRSLKLQRRIYRWNEVVSNDVIFRSSDNCDTAESIHCKGSSEECQGCILVNNHSSILRNGGGYVPGQG